jgi:hypothetical protein
MQYHNYAQSVKVISFPTISACLIFLLHENTFRPLGSSRFYHTNKIRCTAYDILQTASPSVLAAQDVYRRRLDCWDRRGSNSPDGMDARHFCLLYAVCTNIRRDNHSFKEVLLCVRLCLILWDLSISIVRWVRTELSCCATGGGGQYKSAR